MDSKNLKSIGLTKNEAEIYISLVKLGLASVSEISKFSKIHRANIYEILEKLKRKGLVALMIKSNKKYFKATNPKIIQNLITELETKIKETKTLLPKLIEDYNNSKKPQEILTFKGILGVKSVFRDILESKPKEILNFGSTKSFETFPKLQIEIWEDQRIQSKIPMKIITSNQIKSKIAKRKLQKIKFVEKPFENFTSTIIYNDKVAIFMWTEEPMATIVQSKELADSYRNYFESLWG